MNAEVPVSPGSDRTDPRVPRELQNLVYWLSNEDIYTSDYVRTWMEHASRHEAGEVLARIAAYAQPEPRSCWYGLLRGFLVVFGTSGAVSTTGAAGRKAGVRAALLLATLGDLRAIPPLVRAFETHWNRRGKYQDAIESGLLRLLSPGNGDRDLEPYAGDLLLLAARIWNSRSPRTDLSLRLADLEVAALDRMRAAGGSDRDLLAGIAATQTRLPHQTRVRDHAIQIVNGSA